VTASLDGYETGPDATRRATAVAWARLDGARAVVLVEGVSDQIAVDATARVLGLDLVDAGVVVMPIGGAQAIGRTLPDLAAHHDDLLVGGLCDVGEEAFFERAVGASDRAALESSGFFVCVDDLEDELLRAAGQGLVEQVVDQLGERSAFATMRSQGPWQGKPFEAQFRRFCGARSQRKHRYAAAIVGAIGADRPVRPISAVLDYVMSP
jgi:hypothetical protein